MALYIFLRNGENLRSMLTHQPQNNSWAQWAFKGHTVGDFESIPRLSLETQPIDLVWQLGLTKELFLKATMRITQKKMVNHREYGVYTFGKARAVLSLSGEKENSYLLLVETSSLDGFSDMQMLQELIWSGQIAPVISYEKEQKKQSLFEVLKYILSKRRMSFIQRFIMCWKLMKV